MRTIAISDIHGCYNELKNLIEKLENEGVYDKNTDRLVFLGDYIDRGKDSRLVIEFIRNLQKNNDNVIALMGNHEDMMINHYNGTDYYSWTFNGHKETLNSYKGFKRQFDDDFEWIKSLPLYFEDEYFIYVHAGIDVNKPIEKQDRNTLLWIREDFIYNDKEYYKNVIFGHTPTIGLNGVSKPVYTFTNNVDIDTGCVFGGALSALVIDDDEIIGFHQVKNIEEEKKNSQKVNI